MALLRKSARLANRARIVPFLAVALITANAAPAGFAAEPLEAAVKANYLYKFGPFVEWPAGVFSGLASPFYVCVLGDDPFGHALDDATHGQTVAGHPVIVRRVQSAPGRGDCHVLYLGHVQGQNPPDLLLGLRGQPVLTVTDEQDGVSGGIVRLVVRDGRVRFTIDTAAAQASGLVISSKLLSLAIASQPAGE